MRFYHANVIFRRIHLLLDLLKSGAPKQAHKLTRDSFLSGAKEVAGVTERLNLYIKEACQSRAGAPHGDIALADPDNASRLSDILESS